eukprot:TRINITY_DN5179_c0_g1_i1.p1 TRINITY_DN5179_c0_g1~~TRINITY_DN5179_c0_g1_i1.p1  ORF type:complete len:419 (-),score=111.57 TRINITY_DN5179_c0_g1_i1:1303-2559(-)
MTSWLSCLRNPGEEHIASRWVYLGLFAIGVVVALILGEYGSNFMTDFVLFSDFGTCTTNQCLGNQAIFRVSFAMTIFFVLLALFTVFLPAKYVVSQLVIPGASLIFFLLVIFAFFIGNGFYNAYANVARAFTPIFLLLQIIVLIDFGYRWNEAWVEKDNKSYLAAIVAFSFVLLLGSLGSWIFFYIHFTDSAGGSCSKEKIFISATLILCIAFTLLSITSFIEHGALLTSSIVVAYCTLLLYNALSTDPSLCNPLANGSNNTAQVIIGLIVITMSVTYSAWNVSCQFHIFGAAKSEAEDRRNVNNSMEDNSDDERKAADAEDGRRSNNNNNNNGEQEEQLDASTIKKANIFFHLTMALASMYLAMLLTDWAQNLYNNTDTETIGETNSWISIGTQWATVVLYVWTLVAPKCCPGRDFS